jgi:protein-S-isoprenylcysteine O-methyltransferase Ste14
MTLNQLTVNIVLTTYLFIGPILEERRLVQEFGAAYEDYRARTPMMIPGLKPGQRTSDTRA